MNCYHCGGEAEQVPFNEIAQKSKEIVDENFAEADEDDRAFIAGVSILLASGPYGRFRCKECKKSLSAMELIGRSLCKVEPLPPGALARYAEKQK